MDDTHKTQPPISHPGKPTLASIAREVLEQFEWKQRENGSRYWVRTNHVSDDWIHDMCMTAHCTMMPEDYKFEFIHDALTLVSEYEGDVEEARSGIESDMATHDLATWLASHNERLGYCDEAIREFRATTTLDILSYGQYQERAEVFDIVCEHLCDELERRADSETCDNPFDEVK